MKNSVKLSLVASVVCLSRNSTPVQAQIIYDTSWEAPMWSIGNIAGTPGGTPAANVNAANGWQSFNAASGHQVVGTTTFGGITVTPKTGTQMHQSISSSAGVDRLAFVDLRNQFAARDAGNVILSSLDFFLPSSFANSTDGHGITLEDTTFNGGPRAIGQVLFRNSDRSINLLSYNAGTTSNVSLALVPNAFNRDEWFHLDFYANLDTRLLTAKINGNTVASGFFDGTVGVFTPPGDVALTNTSRSGGSVAFSDNYHIAAVPSPESVTLMAGGLAGIPFLMRRRKK